MDDRLKTFMLENFAFESLKKSGFFKGIKKSDYEAQAKRVCDFFGYKSVYEYQPVSLMYHSDANVATGKFPDTIDASGKLKAGGGILVETHQSEFVCPICDCPQEINASTRLYQKCKGCKRQLGVVIDFEGEIHVWDKADEKNI